MIVTGGSTSVSVPFYFVDDVGGTAPGEPTTGLLFSDIETGGSASYQRQGAARVDFTLKTLANAASAYDAGGFILVDDTEMAGTYRCDIPNAAIAAGVDFVIIYLRAAAAKNTIVRPLKIDLTTVDLRATNGRVDIGSWLGTAVTTSSTSAKPEVDTFSISDDAGAADNAELMYDGTGYTDDTAPASRDQVTGLAVSSSAVNIRTIAAPNGFTLTTGSEVNDEDDTHSLDGTKHELTDAAGTLDGLYEFDIEADGLPVSVTITGVYNSNNDVFQIYANAGTDSTPVWQQIGEISGTNSSAVIPHSFDLFSDQIVTDIVGRVQIRVAATGLSSASFDVDQIFVSKSIVTRSIGYAGGAVWVDTNNGIAGVVPYVNGVADRHSDSIASAYTIAAALPTPLTDFHILNGSSVQLLASAANKSFFGDHWTMDLNGQACGGLYCQGATVSGAGTSSGEEMHFEGCDIGTATVEQAHFDKCGFTGTVTLNTADDYDFHGCYSKGTGVPVFTKTAGQTVNFETHDWNGDITISGLESGDVVEIGGNELRTVTINGADATVHIHGHYETLVNNLTGAPTVEITGAIKTADVATILADTADMQPKIGTPAADLAADVAAVKADTAATLVDTADMQPKLGTPAADLAADVAAVKVDTAATLVDTNELQTDWADGGRLDTIVDAILAELSSAGEPGQGAPAATSGRGAKIDYLFKWARNKTEQTATTRSHYNDAGSVVDQKSTVSDDAVTATRGEMVTGP